MLRLALEEDAKKRKIASDGAKHLQAEMTKAKKTPATPKVQVMISSVPRTSATDMVSQKQQPSLKGRALQAGKDGANAIKEKTGREEEHTESETEQIKQVVEQKARPPAEKQKAVSHRSTSPNLRSSSPISSNGISGRKRRSMTPALPFSKASQFSGRGEPPSSSPLSSKLGNMDPPLRSALSKKASDSAPSSAIRRSVSFVSDHSTRAPQTDVSSNTSSASPATNMVYAMESLKSLKNINNQLLAHTPLKVQSLARPTTFSVLRKTPLSRQMTKSATTKRKVQSTLNVTRDSKLKGKAEEPPSSPPKEATALSADNDEESVSSFHDGEDVEARAGPSSRKKASRSFSSQSKPSDVEVRDMSVLDPELSQSLADEDISTNSQSSVASVPLNKVASQSTTSSSRSSSSSSESDDDLDSLSKSTSPKADPPPAKGSSRGVAIGSLKNATSSRSNSKPNPFNAKVASANGLDQAATQQLQRESQASMPTVHPRKSASSIWDIPDTDNTNSKAKADLNGRLPNGMRPANFKYPSLSAMSRAAADGPASSPSSKIVPSTRPRAGDPKQKTVYSAQAKTDSSSESEDSSHSDDSDDIRMEMASESKGTPKETNTAARMKSIVKGLFFRTSSA